MVWCGVMWCGVVECGVVWHGVVWYGTLYVVFDKIVLVGVFTLTPLPPPFDDKLPLCPVT